MAEYDAIAAEYAASKLLPWRLQVDDVRGLEGVDVVMAAYLFNDAQDRAQLRRMAESAFRSLRPGGRLCGINDNPRTAPGRYRCYPEYSFLRYIEKPQREGTSITWSIQPATGEACIFDNFWIPPETYREVFEQVGFTGFRFVDAHVAPEEDPEPFRDFLEDCPICGISATRPEGG